MKEFLENLGQSFKELAINTFFGSLVLFFRVAVHCVLLAAAFSSLSTYKSFNGLLAVPGALLLVFVVRSWIANGGETI